MKKLFLILVFAVIGLSIQVKAQESYDRGYDNSYNNGYDNDGFGYFYTSLSPYGTWIEFGDGVYGWRPVNMSPAWGPYADGRWIWTSDGWYWDSYEPFGYIVYHYGRWYNDDYYGWVWIPDYQWAPSWVEWRYDNDYIGWAPLPPYAVFSISIGIHFTHSYYTPYRHWHFVNYHNFCDPYVGKYYIADRYKYRIYSRTKYRNEYGYRDGRVIDRGVDVNIVRQRGKVEIRERNIRTVTGIRDINNGNRVSDNEIRTFIPGRKDFAGSRVNDVKFERSGRKTTLETSKLEFGRTKIDRKETPVTKNGNTTTREVTKENNVRIRDNKVKEQKRIIPGAESRNNENNDRKEIRKPEQKISERKDQRVVIPGRTEVKGNNETKNSNPVVKNSNTRTQAPPVQKRTESKINNNRNSSPRTSGNPNVQRQDGNQQKGREVNRESGRRGKR